MRGLIAAIAVLLAMTAGADAAPMREAATASAPPTATIDGPAQAFREETVTQTANATDDGSITAYAWDLDDDGAFDDATGPTASTSFSALGAKNIHLQVTDDEGLQTVADAAVTIVNRPPTVEITDAPSQGFRGQDLTFAATGADADPGAAAPTLEWDTDEDGQFDDGTGATATASYSTLGDKTVRVRATDADGGTATDEAVVTIVNSGPTVQITNPPTQSFRGQEMTFTASAADGDPGAPAPTVAWDTDDDGSFDDPPTVSYSTLGAKTVRVQATDADGGTATDQAVVTILNRAPTVDITGGPTESARRQQLTFTAASADADPGAAAPALAWDTDGDGQFDDASGGTATATYSTLGAKPVRVRATDADGGTATDEATVTIVNLLPTAAFTFSPAQPVAGQVVTFTSTSEDRDGTPLDERWDLNGDGIYDDATGHQASRSFPAGTNSVGLHVDDGDGGTFTNRFLLRVLAPPGDPAASATTAPSGGVAGTQATSDTVAPKLLFGVLSGQRLGKIAAKGLRLQVRLGEPASVTVKLTVDKRTARRIGLAPNAKRAVLVARLARTLAAGKTTLRLKLTTTGRRAFAHGRSAPVKITVRAKDAAGNASTQSAKLTLRR